MQPYRHILKFKLQETGMNQRQIAEAMGWGSNSTVSQKLSGKRDWSEGELQRMCELAGLSIVWLAANSDDLVISKHVTSAEIAMKADELQESSRELLLKLIDCLK